MAKRGSRSKEVIDWITVKGVHVPIMSGESKTDAYNRFKENHSKSNESGTTRVKKIISDIKKEINLTGPVGEIALNHGQYTYKIDKEFETALQKYGEKEGLRINFRSDIRRGIKIRLLQYSKKRK